MLGSESTLVKGSLQIPQSVFEAPICTLVSTNSLHKDSSSLYCILQVQESHQQLQDMELAMDAKESRVRKLEYEIKLISGTQQAPSLPSFILFSNFLGPSSWSHKSTHFMVIIHFWQSKPVLDGEAPLFLDHMGVYNESFA